LRDLFAQRFGFVRVKPGFKAVSVTAWSATLSKRRRINILWCDIAQAI
jgi:hypothetical protein